MSEKKNVLLITVDALRADHVSCLGYHRKTTPNIDKLAGSCVLFTQAIANGSPTPASFPSLLTSSYPLMYRDYPYLSKFRTTIAEVLKANGYSTAAFHSNPYLSRYYGYNKGFDIFEDFLFEINNKRTKNIREKIKVIVSKNNRLYKFVKRTRDYISSYILSKRSIPYEIADTINQKAISWLQDHPDNFFVWLHYMDVHHPYKSPQKYIGEFHAKPITEREIAILNNKLVYFPERISRNELRKIIDFYDAEIKYVDYAIKSFLDKLNDMKLLHNTIIIITADHGEEFKDHGGFCHRDAKLYDELLHVPLVINCPGICEGIVIRDQVSLIDLAPTILDFLGIQKPKNFQGISLIPLIKKERKNINSKGVISEVLHNAREVSFDGKGKRLTSYRTKEWKYIINEETNQHELYDLQNDPKETKNIVDNEAEKAEEFKSKIEEHILREKRTIIDEKEKISKKLKELKLLDKI